MIAAFRIGRFEFTAELWCPVSDSQNWNLAAERRGDKFDTRALWVGPFHFLRSTLA